MRISDWSSDVCSSDLNTILQLEAVEQRDRLARGALRAVELAEACLEQIEKREPEVGAWSYLDGDHVMQQAKALDDHRAKGRPIGPLQIGRASCRERVCQYV